MKKRKGTHVCANVDYYSGFAYHMLGIDQSLFTPLFATSRCAGWIAHHLENRQNNRKLIRPANIYVGEHRVRKSCKRRGQNSPAKPSKIRTHRPVPELSGKDDAFFF